MSEEIRIDVGDYKITGRKKAASRAVDRDRPPPLIVAIHGGGFTSAYFDCGGYSLLAGFVSNSGHCIDFHLAGSAFHEEQIAFAIDCSARLEAGAAQ
ncbi:hypothetical protein JQX13_08490 [Archangium violaceum]|uniref:hypothetical protein n=1 Tax=Archangium violaceum TaxID=83451 RepID=UPI00193B60FB|nr:hypothetical protein [Archangium violaceum]QRK10119.1 hypothetical protein JQX13_08490 [Archangium violaceum]